MTPVGGRDPVVGGAEVSVTGVSELVSAHNREGGARSATAVAAVAGASPLLAPASER